MAFWARAKRFGRWSWDLVPKRQWERERFAFLCERMPAGLFVTAYVGEMDWCDDG